MDKEGEGDTAIGRQRQKEWPRGQTGAETKTQRKRQRKIERER